ncbi:MAG: glycosyltransferase family 61 protein [Rickettsiales bacterium]|jgi:hypothetical protein|nr:glycosyltransferase family 61 protein [Rickettsiales bacterium]
MSNTAYIPDSMKENFDWWNRTYKSARKNSVEIVDGAHISTRLKNERLHGFMRSDCGVFRPDGTYITGSNMWKPHEELSGIIPLDAPMLDANLVWGGELLNHYGHFLIQSTARLYYYLQHLNEYDGIIFVWNYEFSIPAYMTEFLKLAGVPMDKIKIAPHPVRVRRLAVPTLSSFYHEDWTEDFLIPFQNANAAVAPGKNKKIFMSRKNWTLLKADVLGEMDVMLAFQKNGFVPIYPEQLSIAGQIAVIKGAEEIAGVAGTALHNIIYAAGCSDKKRVIMLSRSPVNNVQFILNEMVDADLVAIAAFHNFLPISYSDGPFIIGMTGHLRQFFIDNNMRGAEIKFRPEKYAKKFLNKYVQIYQFSDFYLDLIDNEANKVEAKDFIGLVELSNWPRLRRFYYKIMSRFAFSELTRISANYKFYTLDNLLKGDFVKRARGGGGGGGGGG